MSTLSGTKIKDTYSGLLKTTDNAALSGTFKAVTDGAGNNSGLELNTTYARATNGILFGSDTAAANALDDYEEGSWAPTISSGTHTYTTRTGEYVKIGKLVILKGTLYLSSRGASGGELGIGGLPFASAGTPSSSFNFTSQYGAASLLGSTVLPTGASAENTICYLRRAESTAVTYTVDSLAASGGVVFTIIYTA